MEVRLRHRRETRTNAMLAHCAPAGGARPPQPARRACVCINGVPDPACLWPLPRAWQTDEESDARHDPPAAKNSLALSRPLRGPARPYPLLCRVCTLWGLLYPAYVFPGHCWWPWCVAGGHLNIPYFLR